MGQCVFDEDFRYRFAKKSDFNSNTRARPASNDSSSFSRLVLMEVAERRERCWDSAGANPTRRLVLLLEVIGPAVEVTNLSETSNNHREAIH